MSIANEIKSSKDLLEVCKNFKKIAIAGPRRSGTTFTTKQLAKELNYEAVYLEDFYTHDEDIFVEFLKNDDNCVIQCPTMCHILHEIQDDQLLIIFLYRNLKDIEASEIRISFHDKKNYLRGVHMNEQVFEKSKFLKSNIPDVNFYDNISKIKYDIWESFQRKLIKNKLELNYETLQKIFKDSWVNKKDRRNFLARQTQIFSKEDILLNRNQEVISISNKDHFCQLFIDEGDGFSEKKSIRQRIFSGLNKVSFNLSDYEDIKGLRFDPLNDYAIVEIIKIESGDDHDNRKSLTVEGYNGYKSESDTQLIFDHQDPNIFLSGLESKPAIIVITFKLENLETILRYLFEKKTIIKETPPQELDTTYNTALLKKINGKLNLQSGELEYLKTIISSVKSLIQKESSSRGKDIGIIHDQKAAAVIETEELNLKLGEIESTLSKRQLTIKSLLDMTGVEIKSALDKINETFESNEKNKLLIDSYRKASNTLEKEIAVINYKLEESLKSNKSLNSELSKLSKIADNLIVENIKLKESVKLMTKSEKSLQAENKKLIKENINKANFILSFKEQNAKIVQEIGSVKSKFQELNKEFNDQSVKYAKLEEELQHKRKVETEYNKLLKELNFLSSEL